MICSRAHRLLRGLIAGIRFLPPMIKRACCMCPGIPGPASCLRSTVRCPEAARCASGAGSSKVGLCPEFLNGVAPSRSIAPCGVFRCRSGHCRAAVVQVTPRLYDLRYKVEKSPQLGGRQTPRWIQREERKRFIRPLRKEFHQPSIREHVMNA